MIKLLSRSVVSEQSEELDTDILIQEIEDTEASNVSGGIWYDPILCFFFNWCPV